MKAPFCLAPFVVVVDDSVGLPSSAEADCLVDVRGLDWVFRFRNLEVREETLEMMLPVTEDASEEKVRMLAPSNILGASSDFTEE